MKPLIFAYHNKQAFDEVITAHSPKVIDHYDRFIEELSKIYHPSKKVVEDEIKKSTFEKIGLGNWVYFPWKNTIIHLPSEDILYQLKTSRNRLLITDKEQRQLSLTKVAFLGLSVGSHAAITWMMQSHAEYVCIADFDTLDGSNLNRIRKSWVDVGLQKTILTEQELYEQNPYADVKSYEGVTKKNYQSIFTKPKKIDVIVDLVDSLDMKIQMRKFAKLHRIPVLMSTDIGNNVKIEIERYDLDKNTPFFNQTDYDYEQLDCSSLSRHEIMSHIIKLVGLKNNSPAMLNSILNIGKRIPTWPQLGSTATIGGGVITTVMTKLILEKIPRSGIYWLNFDEIFNDQYFNSQALKNTQKLIASVKLKLNL